jgi:hypothetical protein
MLAASTKLDIRRWGVPVEIEIVCYTCIDMRGARLNYHNKKTKTKVAFTQACVEKVNIKGRISAPKRN